MALLVLDKSKKKWH